MFILLILHQVHASGFSTDIGEVAGLTFIGIACFLVFCTSTMIISRPERKGVISSLIHIIILIQFTRYTCLMNFTASEFYYKFFNIFTIIQDPYELFNTTPQSPWQILRFESTNFIENSIAHLILIPIILLVWIFIKCFVTKYQGPKWNRFFVFTAYASTLDLSVSAFIQIKNLSFDSIIDIFGSVFALSYIAFILGLISLQLFFIYKTRYESLYVAVIIEEFEVDKDYYFYFYFPSMICLKVLYACLLVFTRDKPYTVPIVMSIMNLILFSYIVSIRPYFRLSDMVIVLFGICIEIFFLFFPMIYSVNAVSDIIIDSLTIGILFIGLALFQIKAYLDVKEPKTLTPGVEGKKQTAKVISETDGQLENSRNMILNMSSDEKIISYDDKTSVAGRKNGFFDDKVSKDPVLPIFSGQIADDQYLGNKDKKSDIVRIPSRGSSKIFDFTGEVKAEKNVYNTYKNPNDGVNGIRDISPDTQGNNSIYKNRQNDDNMLRDLRDIDSISNYIGVQEREDKVNSVIEYPKKPRVDLNKFTVKTRFNFE
ncbi:hypothetical protein SteCoe_24430 [Stentor coeruleus]|uniref:Uncharacterized protein n=1 Tax=Stentor coeruleus TaxID=5963 RepID=A0A1R2BHN3_9CILI|nr:hypothetical protein SteCoe_24430 [Stentor coeruleus]